MSGPKRLLPFIVGLGTLALSLAGCSSFPASGESGCTDDAGCGAGERCGAGLCEPAPPAGSCVRSASCGGGERCGVGACEPVPPGSSCLEPATCGNGQRCGAGTCEPVPPGGSCLADGDCGNGERCGTGACEPVPPPQPCVDDTTCAEGEHCLDAACAPLVGDPATCPAPPLSDQLVCSDWNRDECPCYAGIVSFHEKEEGGRLSCAGVVGIFSQFVYLEQRGCKFAALDGQLTGDAVGFGELKLRIAKLPNDTACSAAPDVWPLDGSATTHPAVRITCSATCKIWMEQFPMPPPERLVPDGSFVMGTPAEQLPPDRKDEAPGHTVDLTCFYMDRFEVSRGEYEQCVSAGVCSHPDYTATGEDASSFFGGQNAGLPIVAVTQRQAHDFCRFNEKSLPTEAEWERAARSDPGLFEPWPWGAQEPFTSGGRADCSTAVFAGCGDGPAQLGEGGRGRGRGRGASYYDVADLGGNVREWTRDYYLDDTYERLAERNGAPPRNPEELRPGPLGAVRVVRGGSFLSPIERRAAPPSDALRVSARDHEPENAALPDLGFRCVRYKPGEAR